MIVGKEFEETVTSSATEMMAMFVADHLRNVWLNNTQMGMKRWEDNFHAQPDAIEHLRDEDFPQLAGLDFIFRWWGDEGHDSEGTSGQVDFIWKVAIGGKGGEIKIFRTYIYFTDYDFSLGVYDLEAEKRKTFGSKMVAAFKDWKEPYANILAGNAAAESTDFTK